MKGEEKTTMVSVLKLLSDADVVALWDAVNGGMSEEQVLALGGIERRNLDV